MKDTIQTISRFKENIIIDNIFLLFFIIVFIILLCILRKKTRTEGSILYKVWWIVLFLLIIACMRLFMSIMPLVDVYTDNIKVVEVTDYKLEHHRSMGMITLSSASMRITFTTITGERMYGHMLEYADIPAHGHGYILYAKHSHYVLDCDLRE